MEKEKAPDEGPSLILEIEMYTSSTKERMKE